jgi:hypothetical protein
MRKLIENGQQAESIRRYHRHLQQLGRAGTLDQSAREWISRYAPIWRKHHPIKPKTARPRPRSLAG